MREIVTESLDCSQVSGVKRAEWNPAQRWRTSPSGQFTEVEWHSKQSLPRPRCSFSLQRLLPFTKASRIFPIRLALPWQQKGFPFKAYVTVKVSHGNVGLCFVCASVCEKLCAFCLPVVHGKRRGDSQLKQWSVSLPPSRLLRVLPRRASH